MNFINKMKGAIEKLFKGDRVCAYHKSFAMVAGDVSGGVFLSQLFYWCDKGTRKDGYIFKTYQQWHEEVHLSLSEWDRAKTYLKEIGVIDYRRFGTDPKLYYKINFDVLAEKLMSAIAQLNKKQEKTGTDETQIDELAMMAEKVAQTIEKFPMLYSGLGNSGYRDGQLENADWASDNTGLGIAESSIGSLYKEDSSKNTYKEDLQRVGGEPPTRKFITFESILEEENCREAQAVEINIANLNNHPNQTVTVEKPQLKNVAGGGMNANIGSGWNDFEWLESLYQEYKPSCWKTDWLPKTSGMLFSLKVALKNVNGDVQRLKELICQAFTRVENKPSLWEYSIEWVLRPNNLETLAWEGSSNLYAPSKKTEQELKRALERNAEMEQSRELLQELGFAL